MSSGLVTKTLGASRDSVMSTISIIIIHQTHYEKSDWSRAFNQFTIIACELDVINATQTSVLIINNYWMRLSMIS